MTPACLRTETDRLTFAAALIACVAAAACDAKDGAPASRVAVFGEERLVPSDSAPDEICRDVGPRSVCYGPRGARVADRTLPAEPPPPDGAWRCEGRPRRCRLVRARRFECKGNECRQRFPRVPDASDWECADVDGMVVCRQRSAPAGIVSGAREPGWICNGASRALCVDLSPDRPGATSYDCHFVHDPVVERTCRPRVKPILGAPCHDNCPAAMTCLQGVCVPAADPVPTCWTDPDCPEAQRCVLARCSGS